MNTLTLTPHRFEIARNEWRIINVFDCPRLQKNKYRSIVDLDFFPSVEMIVHSKRYISYRRVSSGYFPRFSARHRLRMLLLQETFGFKWQNESMLSNGKKRKSAGNKRKTCSSFPVTARTKLSSFRIKRKKKEKKNIPPARITVNKCRLCVTMPVANTTMPATLMTADMNSGRVRFICS